MDCRKFACEPGPEIVSGLKKPQRVGCVLICHAGYLLRIACVCKQFARYMADTLSGKVPFTMNFETYFSIAGIVAMTGWLFLLVSPIIPAWSDRIAGTTLPIVLSLGYVALLVVPSASGGGFGTLADVIELFSYERAALAGWVHFLAFDLFIGAWVCRTARAEGVNFWFVVPCLPLIFLFGPAGLLAFQAVRSVRTRQA